MRSVAMAIVLSATAAAQEPAEPAPPHDHMHMQPAATGWQLMQDFTVFLEFNHQGSERGGNEFVAPNWWMGMATRQTARGRLTLTSMLSLDPATVGRSGYRELFQTGETLDGQPLIDRQHPHDLFMQISAAWRVPVTESTGFTLAGGPVGEPAIGPPAFMHRASAAGNPTAPLTHHTFDSTHVSFGVVTAGVDHGPWVVEGSLFNGREPDDNRWDFDFGPLDSWSGRLWFKPGRWAFQLSSARLTNPEALEPGNIVRTTASASWTRIRDADMTALTVGVGRNDADRGARSGLFVEGARQRGATTLYSRLEVLHVEPSLLQSERADNGRAEDPLAALTLGAVRDVLRIGGFQLGFGGDLSLYAVPDGLQDSRTVCSGGVCASVPGYGSMPVSFHLFVRVQPAGAQHRMWNMRMGG